MPACFVPFPRPSRSRATLVSADECWTALASPVPAACRNAVVRLHQRLNAASIATVRALANQIPIEDRAIVAGLGGVHWPGRMQIVEFPDGRVLVLDGAHNPDGAAGCAPPSRSDSRAHARHSFSGVLADKDWPAIVPHARAVWPAGSCWRLSASRTLARPRSLAVRMRGDLPKHFATVVRHWPKRSEHGAGFACAHHGFALIWWARLGTPWPRANALWG